MISELPNNFFLIRCATKLVMQLLLQDGLWTINGIILQFTPWRLFFELEFAKLNMVAIWVQLHNLPIEFWEENTLETIIGHLGNLLKVD